MKLAAMLAAMGSISLFGVGAEPIAKPRIAPALRPTTLVPEPAPAPPVAWAARLPALRFINVHGGPPLLARLYGNDGELDEEAARAIDALLAPTYEREADVPDKLDRRTLRLLVKAAARFDAREVTVVSSWRESKSKGSRHREGKAIDFMLAGVKPGDLARYLRSQTRVGVGIYTHPRTQFVHLDVRDESYHWVDASPPGRVWRESRMTDWGAKARDAAWEPSQDLPIFQAISKHP